MSSEDEPTLSIPSLLFVGILLYFGYRYFFARATSAPSNGLRFTASQVEDISQMFPQLNRRDIMWDLHRNRGSAQATTERILMGRGLDPAPPSFQPAITFTSTPSSAGNASTQSTKIEPDLITRYNLQSKISMKGKEKEEPPQKAGWAANKDERQKMLQRRRDEMILAARRKMQEKDEQGLSTK